MAPSPPKSMRSRSFPGPAHFRASADTFDSLHRRGTLSRPSRRGFATPQDEGQCCHEGGMNQIYRPRVNTESGDYWNLRRKKNAALVRIKRAALLKPVMWDNWNVRLLGPRIKLTFG